MASILTFIGSGRVLVNSVVAGSAQQAVIVGPNGPIGQLAAQLNSTIDVSVGATQTWTLKVQHQLANGTWEDGQIRLGSSTVVNGVPIQYVEGERDLSGGDFKDLVLRVERAAPQTSPCPPSTDPLPPCAPPDAASKPEFRLPYRQPVLISQVYSSPSPLSQAPELGCAFVPKFTVGVAFDPRFEQVWTLQKFAFGDLATTLSLAPLERLVIEVKTSQRTTLERSALESSESLDSAEATLHDTETVNVARSNTTTTNWHVDGQGSISGPLGGFGLTGSLGLSGGYSKNITNTSQYSQNRINERTQKSAHSLKALHKIEVKGASESIVQDRQLRILRNPYRDRALALNFFQLLKYFDVTTTFIESRLSVAIQIADITMDQGFVLANADFLAQHLLDDSLRTDLAFAVAGARTQGNRSDQTPATLAQKALQFLFMKPPIIFDLPAVGPISEDDANDPASSYKATSTASPGSGASAFDDVLFLNPNDNSESNRPFAKVFFTLNFFYRLFVEQPPPSGATTPPPLDPFTNGENAIQLAVGLFSAIKDDWEAAIRADAKGFKNILDNKDRTEGLRRVAGFVAMVEKMLLPLIASVTTTTTSTPDPTDPSKKEPKTTTTVAVFGEETPKQRNLRVLDALLHHLACNKNYYIQRFLEYQVQRTHGQAIVDFAADVWSRFIISLPGISEIRTDIVDFDVNAAFVDKQCIVIPDRIAGLGVVPVGLTPAQLKTVALKLGIDPGSEPIVFPGPATVQIQVPADGVRLEASGGACILQNVPDKPFVQADLNFGPSSVSISEE